MPTCGVTCGEDVVQQTRTLVGAPDGNSLAASLSLGRLIQRGSWMIDPHIGVTYDRVIIDTPAALGVPDTKAVAELCDGIVVVVRADYTSQQDLEAALDILDRRRLLGLVLNGAAVDRGRYGYSG